MSDEQSCLGPDVDWRPIPFHCREGLEQHFAQGHPVGDFLAAVLSNDLAGAVTRADIVNLYILRDYVHFLHAHAPPASYGSRKAFLEWQAKGGLAGIEHARLAAERQRKADRAARDAPATQATAEARAEREAREQQVRADYAGGISKPENDHGAN